MKNTGKRLLCLLLALCLMGQFMPAAAHAVWEEMRPAKPAVEMIDEITVINPLYADVITEEDLVQPSEGLKVMPAAAESEYLESVEEIAAVVRRAMVAKQTEFTFYYKANNYDGEYFKFLVRSGMNHTGDPIEGDYLRWQYGGYKGSIRYYTGSDGMTYITATVTMTYYTTQAQEAVLDQAVDAFLATVDTTASDYQQVRTIYDYICDHVVYDYDNLYDDNYDLKYTAYAAMIDGTAVCQGYALLFYRLALELGIDARLIAGDSDADGDQDHGWNIVCLNGKYYNLDSTWDAGRTTYSWFLQSEEHFTRNYTGHIRSPEYDTTDFHAAYPMDQADFDPNKVPADPNLVAEGTCGDGVFWRFTKDGTLTISGEGDMKDYTCILDGQPWQEYEDSITTIRVEGAVDSIGDYAFSGMDCASLVIEDGVFTIGAYAFYGCTMTEVVIPGSVTAIGDEAFSCCTDLTKVEIGCGVTSIGACAFYSCGSLREINVHGDNACYSSDSRGVLFDKGKTSLICAPGAISGDYSIPEGVAVIDSAAFYACDDLTGLELPDSLVSIGDWAFSSCLNMVRMDMGNGVVTIGDSAFRDCVSLTELVIPDSVTTIGQETFSGCNSLTRLEIGSGVTRMDSWAVEACPSLEEIWFRGSAPSFGEGVFDKVTAVAYYPANNPTWTSAVMQNYGGTITWVRYGAAEEIASGWSGHTQWTLTADGVLTVYGEGNMKNYGYSGGQPWLNKGVEITSVVIREGVAAIGVGAFKDLTTLESVSLPEKSLAKIGDAAFYGCSSLKEIDIPDSVYTIWEYTFKNCTALEKVGFPKNLIKIDQGAFENCSALDYVFIPGDTEIIGAWSFKACTNLAEVDMQWADATEIRAGAFKNCSVLTTVHLPADIQVLGDSCFYGIGATTFTVPRTVTEIQAWCFARAKLSEIIFEGDAPTIGEGAFNKITLTAYHPAGNATWTTAVMKNYGGTVTWTERQG